MFPKQISLGSGVSLAKTSAICVSIFKAYTSMILTVTEGFIVGLFYIQAPQEWIKANTKAFLNYTRFDTKKDVIGISFCSGSLHEMLSFRAIFLLVHCMIIYLHNVATSYIHFKVTSYFWLLLYPCICTYSAVCSYS